MKIQNFLQTRINVCVTSPSTKTNHTVRFIGKRMYKCDIKFNGMNTAVISHSSLCLRPTIQSREWSSRHSVDLWHCESNALSLEHATRVHGPWTRPVNTGVREHGCRFWTPVNTAHGVNTYDTPVTNTARKHECHFWHPCSRSTRPGNVNTAIMYRALLALA